MSSKSVLIAVFFALVGLFVLAFVSLFFLPPRDITLKEISHSEVAHSSQAKPVVRVSSLSDSSDIGVDEKVKTRFYIIVASHKSLLQAQHEAERIIKDPDINIIVLPPTKEGYTRISYGEYSTLEKAQSAVINIRKEIKSDAWILRGN